MKKIIYSVTIILLSLTLTGCKESDVYKVGASPIPHKEILEHVQPILKEQGFEFDIIEFTDYVLPNASLDSKDIIANFFQHTPYLMNQIDEYGYDFINAGGVHIEPIGLYSKDYNSIESLPNNLELIISNSPTDRPRLLELLEVAGMLEIKETTTKEDIINSPLRSIEELFISSKKISFIEVDTPMLYTNYVNKSGDAVLINGNYALDNGLNPLEDALVIEGSTSEYVNIVVCRRVDENNEFIKALVSVLQSNEVQQWIAENYGGAVVPAA